MPEEEEGIFPDSDSFSAFRKRAPGEGVPDESSRFLGPQGVRSDNPPPDSIFVPVRFSSDEDEEAIPEPTQRVFVPRRRGLPLPEPKPEIQREVQRRPFGDRIEKTPPVPTGEVAFTFRRTVESAAQLEQARLETEALAAISTLEQYLDRADIALSKNDEEFILNLLENSPIEAGAISLADRYVRVDDIQRVAVIPVGSRVSPNAGSLPIKNARKELVRIATEKGVEAPETLAFNQLEEINQNVRLKPGEVITLNTKLAYGENTPFVDTLAFSNTIAGDTPEGSEGDFASTVYLVDTIISQLDSEYSDIAFPLFNTVPVGGVLTRAEFLLAFNAGLLRSIQRIDTQRQSDIVIGRNARAPRFSDTELLVLPEELDGLNKARTALLTALRKKFNRA